MNIVFILAILFFILGVFCTGLVIGYAFGFWSGALSSIRDAYRHAGIINDPAIDKDFAEAIEVIADGFVRRQAKQGKPVQKARVTPFDRKRHYDVLLGSNEEYQRQLKEQAENGNDNSL